MRACVRACVVEYRALGDTIDINRAALKSPGVGGSAFAMFRQMDSQAIKGTGARRSDTVLTSVHQNTIR